MKTFLKLLPVSFLLFVSFACDSEDDLEVVTGPGVFVTESGSANIEGELFLPGGEGPFPAMIIVPGSGNEPRSDLEPFVEVIVPQGFALYLYDKRGVGGSTGSYPTETLENPTDFLEARAQDVIGIIELLKDHQNIDPDRLGVFGSSQGAWVNSLVYDRQKELDYIIMASGGVASTGKENLYCSLTDDPTISIEEATEQLSNFNGVTGFDPLPIIETMTLPVLWIYGLDDRSHPARYDIMVLNDLSKLNFTVQVYQNTDHELLDLDSRFPPIDLFDNIGLWLMENVQ